MVSTPIYIPTNSARGFPFLHTLSGIYCLSVFGDGHSDWCEVIPHCGFNLHFSNNLWRWTSFHVFVGHLYVFFGDVSVFHPFLIGLFAFLILSFMNDLYILEINPLSVASFAIYFLLFWGLSFHFVYGFLCCAKACCNVCLRVFCLHLPLRLL